MSEDIYFQSSNWSKICATIEEPNPQKDNLVVIIHALTSGKNGITETQIATELRRRNINSVRMDLNGCGDSGEDFQNQNVSNSVEDVIATIDTVKSMGYAKIDLFGFSVGGLVAMATALQYNDINRIGLKSPMSDIHSWAIEMGQ